MKEVGRSGWKGKDEEKSCMSKMVVLFSEWLEITKRSVIMSWFWFFGEERKLEMGLLSSIFNLSSPSCRRKYNTCDILTSTKFWPWKAGKTDLLGLSELDPIVTINIRTCIERVQLCIHLFSFQLQSETLRRIIMNLQTLKTWRSTCMRLAFFCLEGHHSSFGHWHSGASLWSMSTWWKYRNAKTTRLTLVIQQSWKDRYLCPICLKTT